MPLQERERDIKGPGALIRQFVEAPNNLAGLLEETPNPAVLAKFRNVLHGYTPNDIGDLTRRLLMGIASKVSKWGIDERDAAVVLVRAIPFADVQPDGNQLVESFRAAAAGLGDSIDPAGNIEPLLEAGLVLAPHFPQLPR